jgi:hypothetical protein
VPNILHTCEMRVAVLVVSGASFWARVFAEVQRDLVCDMYRGLVSSVSGASFWARAFTEGEHACPLRACVSTCTFVLVKQVN